VDLTEGLNNLKLLEHAMKVVEMIFEHRTRQQIDIDDSLNAHLFCLSVSTIVEMLPMFPINLKASVSKSWVTGIQ